jgi:hypothetical protein
MSWYKVTLPLKDCGINGRGRELQDAFMAIFMTYAGPLDAAMFSERSEDFEEVFFYFSPGAARIATTLIESYKAVPCPAPLRENVALAAGDADALETLLPSRDQNN